MKRKDSSSEEAIIGCLLMFITLPIGAVWSGFVLSVLWGWFVVPTFGAPILNIPAAIGIAGIVSYLTRSSHKEKTKDDGDPLGRAIIAIGEMLLLPAFSLSFGWLVHLFM